MTQILCCALCMCWWSMSRFSHLPFLCVLVAFRRQRKSVRRCLQSQRRKNRPKLFIRGQTRENSKERKVQTQWIICDVTPPTFSSPALAPVSPAAAPLGRLVFKLGVPPWRVHERSLVSSQGTAGCRHEEGTGRLQLSDWPNVPVREKSRIFIFSLWCFCLNRVTMRWKR